MKTYKPRQKLLEKYIQEMLEAVDNDDEEIGHINCDNVLCNLLYDLGYEEVLNIYDSQRKWYA